MKLAILFLFMLFQTPSFAQITELEQKDKVEQVEVKLKKAYGPWYKYLEAGKELLCKYNFDKVATPRILDPGLSSWNKNELKKEAEQLLGKKISSIKDYLIGPDSDGLYIEGIKLHFKYPLPSSIEIRRAIRPSNKEQFFAIQLINYNKKELLGAYSSAFDSNCAFISTKIQEYDGEMITLNKDLDSNANIIQSTYKNRDILSLEEIYGDCTYDRSFSEIFETLTNAKRILVTVIDTGVNYNNRDIAYKIHNATISESTRAANRLKESELKKAGLDEELKKNSSGWDLVAKDNKPYNLSDLHGTIVAGIIVKGTDNIVLLPIRTPLDQKTMPLSPVDYKAVELAYSKGSRIINISFNLIEGWFSFLRKTLHDAIKEHPDILFVAAAGNDGNNLDTNPVYPAAWDDLNILTVTAVDRNNKLLDISNYSKTKVDIAALGEKVPSIRNGNILIAGTGTSFATPLVTRVAAEIKFIDPSFTPEDIIAIIKNSGTPVESLKDKVKCACVLNEKKAIELAKTMSAAKRAEGLSAKEKEEELPKKKREQPSNPMIR